MSNKVRHFYEFEEFRLDANNPSLWRADELVSISPKALETLILLVQKKGEIVSREELIETIWKDTFVEEGNINYTISLLRKIFENKDLIKTVPRHGYRFTAEVREISQNGHNSAQIAPVKSAPIAKNRPFRWVLVSVFIVGILFLTSFAYFWPVEKPAKASGAEPGQNSEAMQSYLRGKMILDKRSVENREEKAIDEFQRAVTLDPTLAIAYAGLAEGFATTAAVKTPHPQNLDIYAKARKAVDKALALDNNLAEGYLIRGWIRRNADWDWPGAESDLRRAIALNPNSAIAHQRLAQTLSITRRHDEALAEIKIAYELDPISDVVLGSRFPILEARGDYDEGLKESETLLMENKESFPAIRACATFLYHKREFTKVIELGEKSLAKNPAKVTFAWLSLLAASYTETGQIDKADEFLRKLESLSQTDSKAMYSLAMNYAETGRPDEAIWALQQSYETREERMVWINVEPRFVNLRSDLRFQELLQKMNFK